MIKILLAAYFIALAGCRPESTEDELTWQKVKAKRVSGLLVYAKDLRTGICFAMSEPGSNWGMMATVPCTPEVEKLIGDGK